VRAVVASDPAEEHGGAARRADEKKVATSHASLANYISQISGQSLDAPTTNNDCISLVSLPNLVSRFYDSTPGADAPDSSPGRSSGDDCVSPTPDRRLHGAHTIGYQLDAANPKGGSHITCRTYAEDTGNTPARDPGTPDPLVRTECAHAPLGGADPTNTATAADQFATRRAGFLCVDSVIDHEARCAAHVGLRGKVTDGSNGAPDTFTAHLAQDFSRRTRPGVLLHHPEPRR
jgi:hypothetical protein